MTRSPLKPSGEDENGRVHNEARASALACLTSMVVSCAPRDNPRSGAPALCVFSSTPERHSPPFRPDLMRDIGRSGLHLKHGQTVATAGRFTDRDSGAAFLSAGSGGETLAGSYAEAAHIGPLGAPHNDPVERATSSIFVPTTMSASTAGQSISRMTWR